MSTNICHLPPGKLWEITGPPEAAATLNAFYEFPVLVRSDDGARALWEALDGGACGPSPQK